MASSSTAAPASNINPDLDPTTSANVNANAANENTSTNSDNSDSPLDFSRLFSVKGLVCVVTGGGTGIGLMMATALEHNGAEKVYIVGRRKEVLENAAKVHNKYNRLIPIVCDVTSKSSLQSLVDHITQETGYINLLICNSGIAGPKHTDLNNAETYSDISSIRSFLWDNHSDTHWADTFSTNITGVYLTSVAFLTLLDEGNKRTQGQLTQSSQIITVSSIASFHRYLSAGFAYSASKAGVTHLLKVLGTFLGKFNIRCNIIAPGIYPSQMTVKGGFFDEKNESDLEGVTYPVEMIPMRRAGRKEEMAAAVLWLAGMGGAYTSGCVVVTDGGRLSVLPATY